MVLRADRRGSGRISPSTGFSPERINFVKGDVIETLRTSVPDKIAVLRLDIGWFIRTAPNWKFFSAGL